MGGWLARVSRPVAQQLTPHHQPTSNVIDRRRLPVVMVRTKMAETLKEAVTFIEQVRCVAARRAAGTWTNLPHFF